MTVFGYMGQSLDGYIAGVNHELDWLHQLENPTGDDLGYSAFMSQIDVLLMGRVTFEQIQNFPEWPYQCPVFIASNTLSAPDIPENLQDRVKVLSGTTQQILQTLQMDYQHIYVDGGQLLRSFLREGLLDEMIITTLPILLGEGISLFRGLRSLVTLKLLSSQMLIGQVVQSHYIISKKSADTDYCKSIIT